MLACAHIPRHFGDAARLENCHTVALLGLPTSKSTFGNARHFAIWLELADLLVGNVVWPDERSTRLHTHTRLPTFLSTGEKVKVKLLQKG